VGRETAVDVGVYAGDALVGAGVLHDVVCGIAVWGDDQTTPEIDGALDGQTLTLMLSDDDVDVDVDGGMVDVGYRVLAGEMVYKMDALAVVEIDASSTIPTEFAITSAYPNPFNAVLRIGYALPEAADVRLAVYDLTGRLVSELARGRMQAGMHTAVFDGSTLSSGVYLLRLDASGRTSQLKVALVK
jgi:hypothetical protein